MKKNEREICEYCFGCNSKLPTDCGGKCDYALMLEELVKALKKENEMLKRDHLTKVWNRHYLDELLNTKYKSKIEKGWIYNIALIDLDGLHDLNRTEGYEKGDEFIKSVVEQIKRNMEEYDVEGDIFRIGGDEFVVIYEPYDKMIFDNIENVTYSIGYFHEKLPFKDVIRKLDAEIIKLKKKKGKGRK